MQSSYKALNDLDYGVGGSCMLASYSVKLCLQVMLGAIPLVLPDVVTRIKKTSEIE